MSSTASWRLRVEPIPGAPAVGLRAVVRGGARTEEIPGLGYVTGRLLGEGTLSHDWRALAEEAERRGYALHSYADWDHHGVAGEALLESWELALERLAESLLEPRFDPDRCDWVRRQTESERASLRDQPEVRAGWAFLEQLYHPHPMARPLQGYPESDLSRCDVGGCAAFHRRGLGRGVTVTVAGDVDPEVAAKRWESQLAGFAAPPLPEDRVAAPVGRGERARVDLPPGDQAHLFLGRRTVLRADRDFVALQILAVVLGAGPGLAGRLPERIREAEGLAYHVHVGLTEGAGLDPGHLSIYVGTSPETVEQAERGVREELARICEEGPTEEEVEDARLFLLGRLPFRRETARQVADLAALAELYGVPVDDAEWVADRIREPDRHRIADLAARWCDPEDLQVTLGLPAKKGP